MKLLRYGFLALIFTFFVASPIVAATTPLAPTAAAACDTTFLGIPPWYRGLTTGSECTVISPEAAGGLEAYIVKIVLNVIQMAMVIIAYIAGFFVIYGGFLFITNGSDPAGVEKGRRTVLNAVIGLAIALSATTILNFIFSIIGTGGNASIGNTEVEIAQVDANTVVANALNAAYFIAGMIAVIVIIIAGMSYVTSSGDSGKLTRAKNQILFALAGLILVVSAFTITNFITGSF